MGVSPSVIPPDLYPLVIVLLLSVASSLAGAVIWFLVDMRNSIRERFVQIEQRINHVEGDLQQFKGSIPQVYVMRDDFIRALASLDRKIDKVIEHLTRQGG